MFHLLCYIKTQVTLKAIQAFNWPMGETLKSRHSRITQQTDFEDKCCEGQM